MSSFRTLRRLANRLISSSTREFLGEGRRVPGFNLLDMAHGYFYARWTYFYISFGVGEHPLAKRLGPVGRHAGKLAKTLLIWRPGYFVRQWAEAEPVTLADTYHGKVVPLDAARQLVTINEPVRLMDLEKVVPYARARDIVLQNPDHIVVIDCPCRSARPNPCLPLDVCLIVGDPFASFVEEHHPQRSRRITADEAVAILEAEDARGHAHHAFFKEAMLNRFYAICNCCSCCCGAIQSHNRGTPMLASSGYLAQVDEDLCIGCETCAEACQFGALSLDGVSMQVDAVSCMGCGVCVSHCTQEALSLRTAPEKGEPLVIRELMRLQVES